MKDTYDGVRRRLGERLSRFLTRQHHTHDVSAPTDAQAQKACLRPGTYCSSTGRVGSASRSST